MRSAILLISCPDQMGLVAQVTSFLHRHNGNVIGLDQHVDAEQALFVMRLEWELDGFGLDPAELLAEVQKPGVKQKLRANTDELIARGGFGSPTIFVDGDDMYFGNDRLPLVREALRRAGR